jgi:hypothetical protein
MMPGSSGLSGHGLAGNGGNATVCKQSFTAAALEDLAGRSRRHYLPPNFYGFTPPLTA